MGSRIATGPSLITSSVAWLRELGGSLCACRYLDVVCGLSYASSPAGDDIFSEDKAPAPFFIIA